MIYKTIWFPYVMSMQNYGKRERESPVFCVFSKLLSSVASSTLELQ